MHWLKVPVPRVQAKPNPKAGRQTGQTLLQLLHQSLIGQVYDHLNQAGAHWHNGSDKADETGAVNKNTAPGRLLEWATNVVQHILMNIVCKTHHHDYVQALL